jgi:hypothetical protein
VVEEACGVRLNGAGRSKLKKSALPGEVKGKVKMKMKMKKIMLTLTLMAVLLVPGSLLAQEEAPVYIWINYLEAKPGQGDALAGLVIEEDAKQFDPLVDGEDALSWGLAMPVIHDRHTEYSHLEWISFNGWAGADAFMAKFMEMRQAMSQEEREDLMAKAEQAVVSGSHADDVYRVLEVAGGSERKSYINIGYYSSKPGKAGEAKEFWDEVAKPVYEQLLADGVITEYGLAVPAVHHGENHTHMGWYGSKDLATRDKVTAAFDASNAARSEEEGEALGKRWAETFEPEKHSDQILMVIHEYTGSGESGE